MVTIESATHMQVAKFMEALESRGIGKTEVQNALESIVILNKVAAVMMPPIIDLDLNIEFNQMAMNRLVKHLFSGYHSHQRSMQRLQEATPEKYVWLSGSTPEKLAATSIMRELMEGLSERHIAVVVLRSGFIDGEDVPVKEVARRLQLPSSKQVSHLRTQANQHMKARARELYPFGRWVLRPDEEVEAQRPRVNSASPIEDLWLRARAYNVLVRQGIHTVGELLEKSYEDVADYRNLGRHEVDEIERILGLSGLHLRRN